MDEAKISLPPSQNVQPAFYVRLEPPAKEIRLFSRRGPAAGASPCLRYAVPVDLGYVYSGGLIMSVRFAPLASCS